MDWKPVKSKGARSPQGQRHARELDRIKAPFLKRVNGDGSVSRKKGNALFEVSATEEGAKTGTFLCLGDVDGRAVIVGSDTGRGAFKVRSEWEDLPYFQLTGAKLYGSGLGAVVARVNEPGPDVTNYLGYELPRFRYVLITTPDGRKVDIRHVTTATKSSDLYAGDGNRYFEWSGIVLKNGEHTPRTYLASMDVEDGQHVPKVYADSSKKFVGLESISIPVIPGFMCIAPSVYPLDTSGRLLLVSRYIRHIVPVEGLSVFPVPGIVMHTSSDNGATWEPLALHGMFADAASLSDVLVGTGAFNTFSLRYNAAVYWTHMRLFCTDPSQASGIAICTVPRCRDDDGEDRAVRHIAKVGRYNGFTFTEGVEVGEYFDGSGASFVHGSAVPFVREGVQGILFVERATLTEGEVAMNIRAANRPKLMWSDGVTVTQVGTMPFPNWATGHHSGIAPGKIVCPMYDGDYSLYELKSDMTWAKRATIYKGGPVPSTSERILRNFNEVTRISKDGRPMSATPSAPWMTDSRKSPIA